MKYCFLFFSICVFFTSCSENSIENKIVEEEIKIKEPKPIIPGYKILKKTDTSYTFDNNSSPYSSISKIFQTTEYKYHQDNSINEISHFLLHQIFDYNSDTKTIGTNISYSSISTNNYAFTYENDKISYIFLKHTQANGRSWHHHKTDFTYDNNGRLIRYNTKEVAPQAGSFQTDYLLSWTEDLINFTVGERADWPANDIELDEHGNFKRQKNTTTIYDNKNNPDDLVYPKHLLGYRFYGSGNILNYGKDLNIEYTYNSYDFPTKYVRSFDDDTPDSILTYEYEE